MFCPLIKIKGMKYIKFIFDAFYYLLGKGGYMFLVALVCLLSVCLSVDNIIQKVMNGLGMKFYGGVLGKTMKN